MSSVAKESKENDSKTHYNQNAESGDKKKILKAIKHIMYRKTKIKMRANVFYQKLCKQKMKERKDIIKVLKEKHCQPKILYLVNISFKCEFEIKVFETYRGWDNLLPVIYTTKSDKRSSWSIGS